MIIIIPRSIYVPEDTPFVQSPAFFPILLSLAVVVLGLIIVGFKENVLDAGGNEDSNSKDFAAIISLFVLYYLLINSIGFLLASIFILYGFMKMFGAKGRLKITVVAIFIPISLFYFFEAVDVNFPLGIVTEWTIQRFAGN